MKSVFFGSLITSILLSSSAYAQTPEKLNIYNLQGTCQYGFFGSGQCKSVTASAESGKLYYVTNAGKSGSGNSLGWYQSYQLAGGGSTGSSYYFTLDAKQNDLIFGKSAISGGSTGTIKLNDSGVNVYSSLEVKAKNIYIGGSIIMAHDSTGFKLGFTATEDVTSDADFSIRGTTSGTSAGILVITAKNFTSTGTITLSGDSTHLGETLNVSNVSGKTSITTLTATRGNVNANTDFNVTNLNVKTADFNPTTDLIGNGSTKFNITNLSISAGWGATTKATAKFTKGVSLTVSKATISDWSILDASDIASVTIDTLESSYATIKAGSQLTIKNATFSKDETYLYSQGTITVDTISFNNAAKLYIKQGTTLTAKNLTMNNGSWLVAQSGNNSSLTGDVSINQIDFDNSRIYANNLTTDSITIKNNAGIYLKSDYSGTYTNNGDLNISDGSKLEVFGNMVNSGSLNLTLTPGNTELIYAHGTFQFNMDAEGESKKYTITNIVDGKEVTQEVTLTVPKAKINLYTSSKDLITGVTYTLIKADKGISFKKDGKTYNYNQLDSSVSGSSSSSDSYSTLSQVLSQNIFFYDNTDNNKLMNVDFKSSSTNTVLSFSIATQGIYVGITPYIKPGTWVFGIGSGNAVFGIMNGAGGLARNYTLTLEAKTGTDTDGTTKPVIYYLQNYTYHNSGNTSAVFTVDATGSKFVLGKNRETAGETGKIAIGDALARSTMKVKADSIYLGGQITLGDGALISGHLNLETTKTSGDTSNMHGFIGSNDNNHDAVINIRNHSSLTATGDIFNYQGTIQATGNGTVTDEVTLNLSGITGAQKVTLYDSSGKATATNYGIYIYKLVLRDAKKRGTSATSGGVSMSNFLVDTLNVNKGNNTYSEFLTSVGTSKINTLTLVSGTSSADAAELRFSGTDSSSSSALTVGDATLGAYSILKASNINNFIVTQSLSVTNATATFNNLDIEGTLTTHTNSSITVNGNLTLKNGANFYLSSTINPITVTGTTTIYMNTNNTTSDNVSQSIFNIYNLSNVRGAKVGTTYTLIDAKGGITYHYTNSSGTTSSGSDSGFQSNLSDRMGFYESSGSDRLDKSSTSFDYNGIIITKVVENNTIGFKIDTTDALIPYDKNRIEYYFYRKGGEEWINAIKAIGPDAMEYFQVLMMDKNNALWANNLITAKDLSYFEKIGKVLQSTADQIGSPTRKASTLDALRLATDVNKTNRLVKLSSTKGSDDHAFARMIEKYKKVRFAAASSIASDASPSRSDRDADATPALDLAAAYSESIRDTYKNNVWASAIGVANFVQGGNATLYGLNSGYDRSFNIGEHRVIVGGYVAYAYSTYYGNLIQNNANNLNAGIYIRGFIPHGELDFSASETIGFNNEFINSTEDITKILNQSYNYQSYITNINFNYGYLFYLQDKSLVLKPQIGLSYFYVANSKINGISSDAFYSDIWAKANADGKNVLTLNIALETRKYVDENSYWYVLGGVSQDLFVLSNGDELIRFVGQNTLSYQKGDRAVNMHLNLTIGGELEIFRRTYLTLGLGSKLGVFYKDIGISGNIGARYIF